MGALTIKSYMHEHRSWELGRVVVPNFLTTLPSLLSLLVRGANVVRIYPFHKGTVMSNALRMSLSLCSDIFLRKYEPFKVRKVRYSVTSRSGRVRYIERTYGAVVVQGGLKLSFFIYRMLCKLFRPFFFLNLFVNFRWLVCSIFDGRNFGSCAKFVAKSSKEILSSNMDWDRRLYLSLDAIFASPLIVASSAFARQFPDFYYVVKQRGIPFVGFLRRGYQIFWIDGVYFDLLRFSDLRSTVSSFSLFTYSFAKHLRNIVDYYVLPKESYPFIALNSFGKEINSKQNRNVC